MESPGVLLDDDQDDERDASPPLKGIWAAIAGGAVIVVIAFSSSSLAPEGLDPPASALPSLPTVTIPPIMAEGQVVDQTLEWVEPVGLGDARHIGGVVEFRGLYWVFGAEERGITAWTSIDGTRWSEEIDITITGEWKVDAVNASEAGLAVAASGWSSGAWKNYVFSSPDGARWGFRSLPIEDSSLVVTALTAIDRIEGDYLVQGWVGPEPVAQYLPEPFGQLARDGDLRAEVWPDRVRLRLNPGLLVAEIPVEALPGFEPVIGVRHRGVWRGEDLDSLEQIHPHVPEMIPQRMIRTAAGTYVGLSEGFLLTSGDGTSWERAPVNTSAFEIVAWSGGVAGAGRTASPFWWRPGSSDAQVLVPVRLRADPDDFRGLVAGSDVGVGLMERQRPHQLQRQRSQPVLMGSHVYSLMTDDGLAVLRDGELAWTDRVPGSTARVVERSILFENAQESFSIPIDRWLTMTAPLFSAQPTSGPRVIHSLDGAQWSESTWEEITGRQTAADVELYGAGEFLMVVGTSSDGDSIDTIAIGRAVD